MNLWSMYTGGGTSSHLGKAAGKLIFSPGAEKLWLAIERNYRRHCQIASMLPIRIAAIQKDWALLSKRTPANHRSHFLRLKSHAAALASEIGRIEDMELHATGERFNFMSLYDSAEKKAVHEAVRKHNLRSRNQILTEGRASKLGYKPGIIVGVVKAKDWAEYNTPDNPSKAESPTNHSLAMREAQKLFELLCGDDEERPGIIPNVNDMLRRLASYFEHEAEKPPLKRPAFENAERNHFARGLCHFFAEAFGKASPRIISAIVCIFYEQGITDNEVSQMIKNTQRPQAQLV